MNSDRAVPVVLAALGFLCACGGDYSNTDLEFLNALPARQELTSRLPAGTSRGALSAGLGRRADALALGEVADDYQATRDASATFNGALGFLLDLVEAARSTSPTSRTETSRTWGPFPVSGEPGFVARLVIERASDSLFTYRFEFRRASGGAWFALFSGSFASSGGVRRGVGDVVLDAQGARANGLAAKGLEQLATLAASYRTQAPPVRVDMRFVFTSDAPSPEALYQSREQPDGQGAMRFVFSQSGQTLQLTSRWLPDGRGVGEATILQGSLAGATQVECWDRAFLLRFLSRSWDGTLEGDAGACPAALPWAD